MLLHNLDHSFLGASVSSLAVSALKSRGHSAKIVDIPDLVVITGAIFKNRDEREVVIALLFVRR